MVYHLCTKMFVLHHTVLHHTLYRNVDGIQECSCSIILLYVILCTGVLMLQQTQDFDPMLDQCWASVVNGGPILDASLAFAGYIIFTCVWQIHTARPFFRTYLFVCGFWISRRRDGRHRVRINRIQSHSPHSLGLNGNNVSYKYVTLWSDIQHPLLPRVHTVWAGWFVIN